MRLQKRMAIKTKSETASKTEKKKTHIETLSSMAMLLATALFIITFNVQAFEIPTSSMENTLLVGDHVFVDRITAAPPTSWALFEHTRRIERGDIIVFYSVETPDLHLVKRVIGIPGDRIHLRDGIVYRNGVALKEPYVLHSIGDYVPYRDNFPSIPAWQAGDTVIPGWPIRQGEDVVVPPGRYFVMGDNRDVSHDSRYFGTIPRENIIGGRWSSTGHLERQRISIRKHLRASELRSNGHVALHFVDQTRWSRMLRSPR